MVNLVKKYTNSEAKNKKNPKCLILRFHTRFSRDVPFVELRCKQDAVAECFVFMVFLSHNAWS